MLTDRSQYNHLQILKANKRLGHDESKIDLLKPNLIVKSKRYKIS